MRSFINKTRIWEMNIEELICYRKSLKNVIKDIKSEINMMNKTWDDIDERLQYLEFKLQARLKILEKKRQTASTVAELAELDLQ